MWSYDCSLVHYGVKGMKWGVRHGPPYPIKRSANDATPNDDTSSIAHRTKTIVRGHVPTPKKSTPNSILDHLDINGKVDSRTFYGKNGYMSSQIHPKGHGDEKNVFGQHGEHTHEYEWNDDGTLKTRTIREVSDSERKDNGDIL